MNLEKFHDIFPYVRMVRIKRALDMSGKWQDIDNVFTYINEGRAEFIIEGIKYSLKQGDMIVIPPYATHIIISQGSEPLVQYIFHFDFYEDKDRLHLQSLDCLDSEEKLPLPKRERILSDSIFIASATEKYKHIIQKTFLLMDKEFTERRAGSDIMLRAYAMELLTIYFRHATDTQTNTSIRDMKNSKSWIHIENAIEYINRNYRLEELDNETIAEAIGLSANYLTNLFQEHLGFSLHTYVINLKIEKAKRLMITEHVNITEAAARSGFSSIHVFSKTFKRMVGMTPSEFLERNVLKGKFASLKTDGGTADAAVFYSG